MTIIPYSLKCFEGSLTDAQGKKLFQPQIDTKSNQIAKTLRKQNQPVELVLNSCGKLYEQKLKLKQMRNEKKIQLMHEQGVKLNATSDRIVNQRLQQKLLEQEQHEGNGDIVGSPVSSINEQSYYHANSSSTGESGYGYTYGYGGITQSPPKSPPFKLTALSLAELSNMSFSPPGFSFGTSPPRNPRFETDDFGAQSRGRSSSAPRGTRSTSNTRSVRVGRPRSSSRGASSARGSTCNDLFGDTMRSHSRSDGNANNSAVYGTTQTLWDDNRLHQPIGVIKNTTKKELQSNAPTFKPQLSERTNEIVKSHPKYQPNWKPKFSSLSLNGGKSSSQGDMRTQRPHSTRDITRTDDKATTAGSEAQSREINIQAIQAESGFTAYSLTSSCDPGNIFSASVLLQQAPTPHGNTQY